MLVVNKESGKSYYINKDSFDALISVGMLIEPVFIE